MLQHVKFAANQRVELGDMNALGSLGLANLARLAAGYFAPGVSVGRVVRGGEVSPTSPASKNVRIRPLAAVGGFGVPVLLETEATEPIADNASGNPRIDLVTVSAAIANTDNASRKFWNPTTEESFDANTDTRTSVVVSTTVTQGVPGATPLPPATPAGHIPLAWVTVPNGMSSIAASNIIPVEASFITPVKSFTWQWGPDYAVTGNDTPVNVPYQSPAILSLNPAETQISIILAQVHARMIRPTGADLVPFQFRMQSWDLSVFAEIGRADVYHDQVYSEPRTATVMGILPGGSGPVTIHLNIDNYAGTPGTGRVTLRAADQDSQPLINKIVAITL